MTGTTDLIQRLTDRFASFDQVGAIALGGSRAAGSDDSSSDIDLYVFTRSDIPAADRLAAARAFSPSAHLNDYWGPGAEWIDPQTGTHCDIVFFDMAWMRDQLERTILQHQGSTGYSTCFWHTMRLAQPQYDPAGWLSEMKNLAESPYPEPLMRSIIAMNHPILRQTESAYYAQIDKALRRLDWVSVNHRVAALLASYFDILFAVNRLTHPGEKRLIETAEACCERLPKQFAVDVRILVRNTGSEEIDLMADVTRLLDRLDDLLKREGLL